MKSYLIKSKPPTNEVEKLEAIKRLEKAASKILQLKEERELRRPILIEFCGTPKSGKTTTITALNLFLRRNDFDTVVLNERAGICPVPTKTHPFFNLWTMTSALAEIIKNLSLGRDKVDIIISDRGIFDALCWFEWLNKNPDKHNPYLDDESFKTIKNFSLMSKWTTHLDLVYVFKVDPKESLKREYANLLTRIPGSIMNEPTIRSFNKSIDYAVKKYRKHFRLIEGFDTTNYDPDTVSFRVTSSILGILHDMLIEKIGYIDFETTNKLVEGVNNISQIINCKIQYLNRDKVEHGQFLQPISIAVITNKERNKILVVKKSTTRTSKDSPEMNKLLLYIGGHIRQEDDLSNNSLSRVLENTLHREIHEEIGESISIKDVEPFLIYSTKSPKSRRHLAVCYVITMDLENQSFKLTSDEFVMKTGKSKSGHVLPLEEIISGKYNLEAWSLYILKYVFNKEVMTSYDLFDEDI